MGLEAGLWARELFILAPIAVWSLFWMGLGLWFSAKNGEKAWFIFFLLVHLIGVPEIIYLHRRGCWPFKPKGSGGKGATEPFIPTRHFRRLIGQTKASASKPFSAIQPPLASARAP